MNLFATFCFHLFMYLLIKEMLIGPRKLAFFYKFEIQMNKVPPLKKRLHS